ncbi:MAG: acyl carrier protein [Chitinispirillaceae bacterium]|nr:acyl carrier protein [Chitinispirillaceae bacterium]
MTETANGPVPTMELKREIKKLIISTLKLSGITPDDIDDGASLFDRDGSLGIDSIDALEIVMMLQKSYGVHIDNNNLARVIVNSVDSIATFIAKEKAAKER